MIRTIFGDADENNPWMNWMHNVIDEYKNLSVEEIRNKLKEKAFPYAILMENWRGDFNLGQCVRNANAFGAKEVFYIGKRHYDKRGTVGTHTYISVRYLENTDQLDELNSQYTFVGVDNVDGSVPIESFVWPDKPLMVFGEESNGLTPDMIARCRSIVKIGQFGSVRSLNAGCASGIACYDFVKKYHRV